MDPGSGIHTSLPHVLGATFPSQWDIGAPHLRHIPKLGRIGMSHTARQILPDMV